MNRKKISPKKPIKKTSNRQSEPLPIRYVLLTLTCGVILVVGFFFAARQHFSSIDYGIKNSKLKKQIDELETDKRQLILAKEIAQTPDQIKKAAQKIGMTMMTASNIEVFQPNADAPEKTKTGKIENTNSKQIASVKTQPATVKNNEKAIPEIKKTEKIKKIEKLEKKTPEVKADKKKTSEKTGKNSAN